MLYTVCLNRYFYATTRTILSPNYPNAYSNNLECYIYVSNPAAQTFIVTFSALHTELNTDWIRVRIRFLKHTSFQIAQLQKAVLKTKC